MLEIISPPHKFRVYDWIKKMCCTAVFSERLHSSEKKTDERPLLTSEIVRMKSSTWGGIC